MEKGKCVVIDHGESLTQQFNVRCHRFMFADTAGRVARNFSWGVNEVLLVGLTYDDFGPDAIVTDADDHWWWTNEQDTIDAHRRAGIPMPGDVNA